MRSFLLTAPFLAVVMVLAQSSHRTGPVAYHSSASDGSVGFACLINDKVPAVGLTGAGVRVSVGELTATRVNQIRHEVGSVFLAYRTDGHDYVITDPDMVKRAMGFFGTTQSTRIPADAPKRLETLINQARIDGKIRQLP